MNKYSDIIKTLKQISQYCNNQQKKQSHPLKSIYLCVGHLSDQFTEYINGQSSSNRLSPELKLPNIRGQVSKIYVDEQVNDVKTIIEKKIYGLNIYQNKIQKINEDIRKQFQKKTKQFQSITLKFQQTLQRKIQNIYTQTNQTIYQYDKRCDKNLMRQKEQIIKKMEDSLLNLQNNLLNDIQKLYKKIAEFELKKNESSPQSSNRMIDQSQYYKNGVVFNTKFKKDEEERIKTANKRQDRRMKMRQQDQRRIEMLSEQKKIGQNYKLKSAIGGGSLLKNFGEDFRQNLKRQKQVKSDWVDEIASGYPKLIVDRNIIIAKQPTDAYCKKIINGSYTFNVTLLEKGFAIGIGVVDSRYRKFVLEKNKYKIVFFADGDFWNGQEKNAKSGKGFKQEQCVTVNINTAFGLIEWKVGEQLRFRHRSQFLKSPQMTWVPYIFMGASQSSVKITEY